MGERLWWQAMLQGRLLLWTVVVASLLLCVMANLPWRLDDYDQAKQAFTSFQMVKESRWLYQTTPHERIATKPPLIGWMSAGLFLTSGSWALAWRLPSLFCAIGIGFLLFRFTRDAYGMAPSLLSLSAFGLNLLTPRLATLVRTDMPLALVVFMVGGLIWQKIRQAEHWEFRDQLVVFLLLTAGMLIKGPVVWAFLVPGIAGFQLSRGKPTVSAFPAWWPWLLSFATFVLWVGGGIRYVPGFYDEVVVREFFGRFGGGVHRPQPLLFYLPHLLHKFAPWSLLILGLAITEVRRAEWNWRRINVSPETRWLICWSLGGLIMMSLLPSKRVDRIFPVIPPLCLLLAAQIKYRLREGRSTQIFWWSAASLLVALVLAGGYVVWKVSSGYRSHRDALVKFGRNVRQLAKANNWRYAVVSSPDEGLLLYLERLRYLPPNRAIDGWTTGQLEALVVPVSDVPEMLRTLGDNARVRLRSEHHEERGTADYVLIEKTATQ